MGSIGISQANGRSVTLKMGGTTQDIINHVLDVIPDVRRQTKGFSSRFTADKEGMRKLWAWVRTNIHYNEDPLGVQWLREPARLWADKEGDCKSMTIFIVSVLENMGIKYKVRFSNTESPGSKRVNHVYPIAMIGGKEVIVDAVYPAFDAQKSFHYAKDYTMSDIYRLSGIGQAAVQTAEEYLAELEAATADIPDDVLDNDVTEMSAGQFARFQAAEKFEAQASSARTDANRAKFAAAADAVRTGDISGIGAISRSEATKIESFLKVTSNQTQRAFVPPVVVIPDGISGVGRIGSIASAIKKAWKKIVNTIFKSLMPLAGMFFLYSFIKKKVGKRTDKRKAGQDKTLEWIQKAGKFDNKTALMEAAKTGIIKATGKSPDTLLNEAAKGKKIAGIGSITVIAVKAISFVIEIIGKIVKLFKKKGPSVDNADAADLSELASEAVETGASSTSITTSTGSDAGGGKSDMIIPLAIAAGAALLLMSR